MHPVFRNSVVRAIRCSSSMPLATRQVQPRAFKRIPALASLSSQIKLYSQEPKPRKIFSFQDVKAHLSNPTPNRILIDTREPHELQTTGTIPGSVNIPISSKPDSFHITDEEFEDTFGFERPGKDQEIVVYCKAGVRSRAAAELARQQGWVNVVEYEGSWLDWEKNGGEKEGGR